jgi:thioredoxin
MMPRKMHEAGSIHRRARPPSHFAAAILDRKAAAPAKTGIAGKNSGDTRVATIELTKENFEQVVNDNDMVVIDFWAPWCAPCRAFAPTFESESDLHSDVVFGKVNTEEQQELAAAFNIRSIPTLMFFRDKVILYSEAGAVPPAMLAEVVKQAKAVDMAEVHREIAAQQSGVSGNA